MEYVSGKLIKAYAVSPAAAVLAVFLLILSQSLSAALLSAGICAIVSYSVALVFGIPCHVLLVNLNARKSIMYVVAGFVVGATAPTYFLLFFGESLESASDFIDYAASSLGLAVVFFGSLGALVAYVFWHLVRPDLETARK